LYAYGGAGIALQGEFDMTGTDRFRSCVNEALATHPRSLLVDAHGLTFIDSCGPKVHCMPVLLPLTLGPHFGPAMASLQDL
jgi:hypothetical protein